MKLIQGDCIEEMNNLINEGVKVDLILTDLPYGTTQCKWDSIIPFEDIWDCVNQLINDRTPCIFFGSEPFSSRLRLSNLKFPTSKIYLLISLKILYNVSLLIEILIVELSLMLHQQ